MPAKRGEKGYGDENDQILEPSILTWEDMGDKVFNCNSESGISLICCSFELWLGH